MFWHDLLATLSGFCLLWQLQIVLRNLLALRHLPIVRRNELRHPATAGDPISVVLAPASDARARAQALRDLVPERPIEILVPELEAGDAPANSDPTVRILQVGEPPPGADPTVHAWERAAQRATGRWIAFLRSNVTLEPTALTELLAHARREELALVSAFPRPRFRNLWERLVEPMVLDALPRDGARAAGEDGVLLSQGGFLLVERAAYETVGGLSDLAVRVGGFPDFLLVERLRAAGRRTAAVLAGELLEREGGVPWKRAWKERVAWYAAAAARAIPSRWGIAPLLPLAFAYGALLALPWLAAPLALWWIVTQGFTATDYATFVMSVCAMGLAVVRRLQTAEKFGLEPSLRTLYAQPFTGLLVTAMMAAAWLRLLRGLHERDDAEPDGSRNGSAEDSAHAANPRDDSPAEHSPRYAVDPAAPGPKPGSPSR